MTLFFTISLSLSSWAASRAPACSGWTSARCASRRAGPFGGGGSIETTSAISFRALARTLVPGRPFPTRAYWVEVPAGDEDGGLVKARVERDSNTIHVEATLVPSVTLLFNDLLVDLSKPVKVVINGVEHTDLLPRSYRTCLKLIFRGTNDPGRIFVAMKTYSVPPRANK